jgi:hypothetical protein
VTTRSRIRQRASRGPWWTGLSDDELLDVRLCDLGLRIDGSPLAARIERLHVELSRAGLRFRPTAWLSTDWFSPHAVPGFAIPFFLAHPRLARLERRQMLEVEGGTAEACMRLLRHETGHAIDSAYRLRRRKRWRERFGSSSVRYRTSYVPNPNSRRYVLNLESWYAQSHPVEDFAETFAVWLQPRSGWRKRYRGWPAYPKLVYVDELMREIADQPPPVRSREQTDSLPKLRISLREYYRRKQAHYGDMDRSIYDRDLRRLFSDDVADRRRKSASSFLREHRRALRRQVSKWTGQHPFVVDEILVDMIIRCRHLRLRMHHSESETGEGAAVLIGLRAAELLRRRHQEYFR